MVEPVLGRKSVANLPKWRVTFHRGFGENNFALTSKICTRNDSMGLFV